MPLCPCEKFLKLSFLIIEVENVEIFYYDVSMNSIFQVRATDQDTLRNRKLTYSIIANNINGAFAIGKRGLVTVRDPSVINRKNTPKYTLEIQAKDDGVPPLSSKTKLQVIVLSNTDTPPQFDKLGYSFNITENNEPNAVLGQIIVRSTKNLIDKKIIVTVINDVSNNFFVDGNNYLKVSELQRLVHNTFSVIT